MTNRGVRRLSGWAALGSLCVMAGTLQAQSSSTADAAIEREFQAAMTAQDRGDLNAAESLLLALRQKHPGFFAVDESLGLLYVAREQFAPALSVLKAAAKDETCDANLKYDSKLFRPPNSAKAAASVPPTYSRTS